MSDYFLNSDFLVTEILPRLDPKTLVKCTSVCKHWNSVITSPSFVSNHSIQSYHHHYDLSSNEEEEEPILFNIDREFYMLCSDSKQEEEQEGLKSKTHLIRALNFPPIDRFRSIKSSFKVVGTCNGLVCVSDNSFSFFILCNPILHKYLLLPPLYHYFSSGDVSIGFGFDPTNNDFKLVKFAFSDSYNKGETWVFSFVSWSWKKLLLNDNNQTPLVPPGKIISEGQSQLFMDGKIHWIARKRSSSSNFILVFDLAQEAFLEILLPERITNRAPISVFKTMKSLAVSHIDGSVMFPPILRVWVMKEYGVVESWTNIVEMQHTNQMIPIPRNVVFMRKNGEMIIEERGGSVFCLNPKTHEIQELGLRVTHGHVFAGYLGESLNLFQRGHGVRNYI